MQLRSNSPRTPNLGGHQKRNLGTPLIFNNLSLNYSKHNRINMICLLASTKGAKVEISLLR